MRRISTFGWIYKSCRIRQQELGEYIRSTIYQATRELCYGNELVCKFGFIIFNIFTSCPRYLVYCRLSWYERNNVKRNDSLRDVKFYAHNVTRCVTWVQPNQWASLDQRAYEQRRSVLLLGFTVEQDNAAKILQQLYRARVARQHLTLLLKAQRLMSTAVEKFDTNPKDLQALCNYTLFTHAGLKDVVKTGILYKDCIDRMNARGGDHAFILYGYAIFLAGNSDQDFWHYVKRGRDAEDRYKKRLDVTRSSIYVVANEYFRYIAIIEQKSMQAWHNYALCRMIAFDDIQGASIAFKKALKRDPSNRRVLQNMNEMLRKNQLPLFDVYDLY